MAGQKATCQYNVMTEHKAARHLVVGVSVFKTFNLEGADFF